MHLRQFCSHLLSDSVLWPKQALLGQLPTISIEIQVLLIHRKRMKILQMKVFFGHGVTQHEICQCDRSCWLTSRLLNQLITSSQPCMVYGSIQTRAKYIQHRDRPTRAWMQTRSVYILVWSWLNRTHYWIRLVCILYGMRLVYVQCCMYSINEIWFLFNFERVRSVRDSTAYTNECYRS